MDQLQIHHKKGPGKVSISSDNKLLVGREEAALMLSISTRALDYLVAKKQLIVRRIGSRVLIPVADLRKFSGSSHPGRVAKF